MNFLCLNETPGQKGPQTDRVRQSAGAAEALCHFTALPQLCSGPALACFDPPVAGPALGGPGIFLSMSEQMSQ